MPSSTRVTQAGSSLLTALDFHQAQPAGAHVGKPVQMAQRGNEDAVLARHFEDGLVLARADVAAVDLQRLDAYATCGLMRVILTRLLRSADSRPGSLCSSMCARYSSRK